MPPHSKKTLPTPTLCSSSRNGFEAQFCISFRIATVRERDPGKLSLQTNPLTPFRSAKCAFSSPQQSPVLVLLDSHTANPLPFVYTTTSWVPVQDSKQLEDLNQESLSMLPYQSLRLRSSVFSRFSLFLIPLVLSVGVVFPPSRLAAQATSSATVQGVVTDQQGAAIPGAEVTLTDVTTSAAQTKKTNESEAATFSPTYAWQIRRPFR